MNTKRRIAVNAGGGYVPGMNAVAAGVARAAHHLGWECVGIRDGYEGVLFPDRYPGGGVVPLTPAAVDGLADAPAPLLGTSRVDPERVRTVTDEVVTEPDRSADVLVALKRERIDAVVSVVDRRAMGIAWKLQKKGLPTVCVPESVENDLAVTELSFGFNTAVSFTVELLDRVRQAARSTHRVAVVEVLGQFAGWLALHAGTAALADAVLIPEIHYDLGKVAARLTAGGPRPALVVVAEGARAVGDANTVVRYHGQVGDAAESRRRALSPGSAAANPRRVIERAGAAAESVAVELRRRTTLDTFQVALEQLLRGGQLTATDRQLGLAYGAAAVGGLHAGQTGAVVAFHPPKLDFVPLGDAVNRTHPAPADSHFVLAARALGICLGDD